MNFTYNLTDYAVQAATKEYTDLEIIAKYCDFYNITFPLASFIVILALELADTWLYRHEWFLTLKSSLFICLAVFNIGVFGYYMLW